MKLSKALEGFIIDMHAGPYSPETVKLYKFVLARMINHLGDPETEAVTPDQLKGFFVTLKTYSGSYQDNHWKAARTFFGWCNSVLGSQRPDTNLPRPRFKTPAVIPLTEQEVRKLLVSCEYTPEFARENSKPYKIKRPTRLRDRAIVLILLDTGLRIGELCRLEIRDIDLQTGEISVAPYTTGRKTRPRTVYLGAVSRRAAWLYLSKRDFRPDDKFIPENPDAIRKVLHQIGENAGVDDVHPHKFRHTFAIQYLRNGGDVFTLQRLLGHASLDMVQMYLALVASDSQSAHKRASPADRWKL